MHMSRSNLSGLVNSTNSWPVVFVLASNLTANAATYIKAALHILGNTDCLAFDLERLAKWQIQPCNSRYDARRKCHETI